MTKAIIVTVTAATLALGGRAYATWHISDTERAKRDVRESLVDPASATFLLSSAAMTPTGSPTSLAM